MSTARWPRFGACSRATKARFVQVASALAYRSILLQSAYCAAKAAIRGFSDSLRSELIHDDSHVRLTHVQLPAVNTLQSQRHATRCCKTLRENSFRAELR